MQRKFAIRANLYRILVMSLAALGTGACFGSMYTQNNPGAGRIDGVAYSLPMREYYGVVRAELKACGAEARIEYSAELETLDLPDPNARFSVSYDDVAILDRHQVNLRMGFFENGALRTLNATAEDRTAEILGYALKTTVTIAALAAGIPPGVVAFTPPRIVTPPEACTEDAKKAVDAYEVILSEAKTILATINRGRMNLFMEKDPAAREQLVKEISAAEAIYGRTEAKRKLLLETQLQFIVRVQLEPGNIAFDQRHIPSQLIEKNDDKSRAGYYSLVASPEFKPALALWLKNPAAPAARPPGFGFAVHLGQKSCWGGEGVGWGKTTPANTCIASESTENALATPAEGFYVRQPATGVAVLWKDVVNTNSTTTRTLLKRERMLVPQAGSLVFLPLQTAIFDSDILSFELNSAGGLVKFEYSSASAAEEAAEFLSESAAAYAEYEQARREARRSANDERLDQLESDIDRVERLRSELRRAGVE